MQNSKVLAKLEVLSRHMLARDKENDQNLILKNTIFLPPWRSMVIKT
jgi:hypothetical protein